MKNRQTQRSSFLAGLANVFKLGNLQDILDEFQPEYGTEEDEYDEEDGEEIVIDDWVEELISIQEAHSGQIAKRARNLLCDFDAVTIDEDGEVCGTCHALGSVYQLWVDVQFDDDKYSAGCTCPQSNGDGPCEHTYRFLSYLSVELRDPMSPLRAKIIGQEWDPPSPPAINHTPVVLAKLDSFLATRSSATPEADDGEDPVAVRVAWKLGFNHRQLELVPMKQRAKKRGGGWTKGQGIALETLRNSPDLIHSPADQQVVGAMRRQAGYSYYGPPKLVFDVVEAVDALVGHDAVFLREEAAEVRRFAFGIRVLEREQKLELALAVPQLSEGQLLLSIFSNGIVACSNELPIVMVCRCDAAQAELAKAFLELPLIPREQAGDLLRRLEKIRVTTPVELPESLAGPIVPAETKPIVLLRSRQQGSLECGMRVKDAHGRLFLPGEGALLYADTRDGRPVQYQRNMHDETTRARRIARELNIDRAHSLSAWNWRVLDFEQSLRLLEDLETKAPELGFEAAWDPKSVESIRIVGAVTARNVRVEVSSKRDWFGLNGGCRIGEHEFQLAELLNGLRSEPAAGYMEIKPGQWARITAELREKLQQLRDVAHTNRKQLEIGATAAPILQDLLETQIDFEAPKAWRDCLAKLDRAQKLEPTLPESFQGTLRDYQLEGYRWLRRLAEWGVGGCLADDMGLGKTIQALAVLIDRQQIGPALVIAPTSVGFNWVREAQRFAPGLKAHLYRETDRAEFLESVGPGDLVVCSYGLALRDESELRKVDWGTLVLDEAQFVKNSRTKTSQAIRTFKADWTLALTGTPMENHLGELWSIFRNVSPGLFGSWDDFRDRFAGPIERDNDDERRLALSRVIRPFVLRRTKSEVLKELPDRTEMNLYVELSDRERRRYDEMRLAAVGEIDQIVGLPDTQDQRFRILALLTRLRQLACHVGLVDEAWEGTSAKLDLLVETMEELRGEGHRALIFSQFTSYLALIRQALDTAGITYEYLDGSTPAKTRQQHVDAFQNGNSDAFLISLKAGGTGLNLTAADYVIHMDPWWNPAVEDQATDRAHRIGQTRPVMVYRIVARGTIEEQILDLHHGKRDLVAGVMEGTQSAGRLATDELVELIRGTGS